MTESVSRPRTVQMFMSERRSGRLRMWDILDGRPPRERDSLISERFDPFRSIHKAEGDVTTVTDIYDVAVIGYGPSGEVAASTLGGAGHRVAVFERQRSAYPLPRMVTFDGEACRTVQATGVSIDHALRGAVVLQACNFGDAEAIPMLTLDWTGTQCGFPAHYSVFQPDIEATLQEKVDAMPNVDVHRGVEVIGLLQRRSCRARRASQGRHGPDSRMDRSRALRHRRRRHQ